MSVLQSERQHNKHQVVAEGNKRVFLPHLSVVLTGVESPQRKNVEDYIATQFFKNHAARVNSFLPFLLSAETKKNITSVIGFQLAEASKSLFVEQYSAMSLSFAFMIGFCLILNDFPFLLFFSVIKEFFYKIRASHIV